MLSVGLYFLFRSLPATVWGAGPSVAHLLVRTLGLLHDTVMLLI
jgi:hypothetical protein